MKVLLVDDDRTVRFLLKAILVRNLGCEVTEAENGLEALDRLTDAPFDLAILDINMPVVDGLQTLRAIRSSPDHASLPVAMISADRQDTLVRECIALGINDYITKPFDAGQIAARLARFQVVHRPASTVESAADRQGPAPRTLGRSDTIVVAEGNDDYRHFVTSALETRFTVVQASSGTRALKLVLETRPAVLMVGLGLGVLGGHQLATLGRQAVREDVMCIGMLGRTAGAEERGAFDAVITRGFVPAAFVADFDALFQPAASPSDSLAGYLEEHLVSASEQFCGMVLGTDAVRVAQPPAGSGDATCAARVTLAGDSDVGVDLEVRCTDDAAALMYRQATGAHAEDVSGDERASVLGEAANIIAGRLQNCLSERGIRTRPSLPAIVVPAPEPLPPGTREYCFASAESGLAFRARLTLHLPAEAAAA